MLSEIGDDYLTSCLFLDSQEVLDLLENGADMAISL